jgi:uncharacterized protein (DUF2236 family)
MTTSATVELHDMACEQGLLLGAASTVFYQLADKGVGLGVAEHSTTLKRPVDRLRTTLLYIYMMVLGTDDERAAITRMVNRAHGPVHSEGRYSAFDPELQLWVAATLARNGPVIYERLFGPLDEESHEQLYRQSQILGTALQVKPEQWPATRADFEDYWNKKLETLESDPAVQVYVQRLLKAEQRHLLLRPLGKVDDLMARGNVDPRVREVLGLTWTPLDQARYDLFWKVFPPIYRAVPKLLRQLPARLIVLDTRRRMRSGKRVI